MNLGIGITEGIATVASGGGDPGPDHAHRRGGRHRRRARRRRELRRRRQCSGASSTSRTSSTSTTAVGWTKPSSAWRRPTATATSTSAASAGRLVGAGGFIEHQPVRPKPSLPRDVHGRRRNHRRRRQAAPSPRRHGTEVRRRGRAGHLQRRARPCDRPVRALHHRALRAAARRRRPRADRDRARRGSRARLLARMGFRPRSRRICARWTRRSSATRRSDWASAHR